VKYAETHGLDLHEVDDAALQTISTHLVADVREVLTIRGSVNSRDGLGGTAPVRVAEQRTALVERVRVLAITLSA
jgi:argininosuccinate lyase